MKKVKSYLFITLGIILLMTSCDPASHYEFKLHNMTKDTLTVMIPNNNGNIYKEGVLGNIVASLDTCIILKPSETLGADWEITNGKLRSYWEDNVTPLWLQISEIRIGDKTLSPVKWKNPAVWIESDYGGGFLESTEKKVYELWILKE